MSLYPISVQTLYTGTISCWAIQPYLKDARRDGTSPPQCQLYQFITRVHCLFACPTINRCFIKFVADSTLKLVGKAPSRHGVRNVRRNYYDAFQPRWRVCPLQRIAIAHAFLRNPKVLLLDEVRADRVRTTNCKQHLQYWNAASLEKRFATVIARVEKILILL